MPTLTLTKSQDCCKVQTSEEATIGVTITHPNGGDGTDCMLDLYWKDVPAGRRTATLVSFDPLNLEGVQACPCGWTGWVEDGVVVE